MCGGATVRAKTMFFLVVILCSFFIASAAFAKNEKEASTVSYKAVAHVKTGGYLEMKSDVPSGDPGTLDRLPGLSIAHSPSANRYHLLNTSSETFKILSFMERRVTDRKLIEKIRDKLPTLGKDRLRMLAFLSEEVAADDGSAKTDIAFLIATTVIIFS
jgi:hypothetical protein